jgi:hypothetical protein
MFDSMAARAIELFSDFLSDELGLDDCGLFGVDGVLGRCLKSGLVYETDLDVINSAIGLLSIRSGSNSFNEFLLKLSFKLFV